ncbi:MAG: pyrimidine 5'-nucleotidase [Anaerolineales bacterium]|nr:pyrimidine 5'-nucleotidase [Anaerolineales bacterium]
MKITTIFFDLDDTLYPAQVGLWAAIKERMNVYLREKLQIPMEEIPLLREKYYLQYGTTLRGLQEHHQVNTAEFLAFVHDLPLQDFLTPNPLQREIIAALPARRLIFTNADIPHAQRTLTQLNLLDLFSEIVDINAVAPHCKPMPQAFETALRLVGETDPTRCVMIDDLSRTTQAARRVGLKSILYNEEYQPADADAQLTDWRDLPAILESL